MNQSKPLFTIIITTKNRKDDLDFTLQKIAYLLDSEQAKCIICDDGSADGTFEFIKEKHPNLTIFQNKISKGLIYSRNRLMALVTTPFAISLDDDLHFITQNPLDSISRFFEENQKAAIASFRIFWSKEAPKSIETKEHSHRIQSFAGGAHVWRMSAWRDIPNYPEWFVFYGEEDFAAYQLFKKNWEIHYLPQVLVHHRVDLLARKKNDDYYLRQRRSLRSGWYLYFLFLPLQAIPLKISYSIWMQLKSKVFKGDWKVIQVIFLALFDLILAFPQIIKNSNRLKPSEFDEFKKIPATKLYWKPENN